jgi:hypothetical protein
MHACADWRHPEGHLFADNTSQVREGGARQNDTPCFWPQPRMALRLGFFHKLGVVPVRKIRSVWNDRLVTCVFVIGAGQSTVKWRLTPARGGPADQKYPSWDPSIPWGLLRPRAGAHDPRLRMKLRFGCDGKR